MNAIEISELIKRVGRYSAHIVEAI